MRHGSRDEGGYPSLGRKGRTPSRRKGPRDPHQPQPPAHPGPNTWTNHDAAGHGPY